MRRFQVPARAAFAAVFTATVLGLLPSVSAQPDAERASRSAVAAFGRVPLSFVENRGQQPEEVLFTVRGSRKTVFFTAKGVTFVLTSGTERWVVKLDFVGARSASLPVGEDRRTAVFSYFRGEESSWRKGVPTFGQLRYRSLWPGIDLVYQARAQRLKYAFLVQPGADPGQIRFRYRGTERVRVSDEGALCAETPLGDLVDAAPVAYQESREVRTAVLACYSLATQGAGQEPLLGFSVGEYDRTRMLVIDPAIFVYCGYIGGIRGDSVSGIAVDDSGNVYVTGGTGSNEQSFPLKVGPDLTYGGEGDVFVAKVRADGRSLIYCGYLGGQYHEWANGIAIDPSGNAYITGRAGTGFPRRSGPTQDLAGAFVTKINESGTDLVYSGFIGGAKVTEGKSIAVDAAGCAYVTGVTESDEKSLPVVVGPDLTYNGGSHDVFVAKVNAAGTSLDYCGYIGGDDADSPYKIAVDPAGRAYVCGWTLSFEKTFPVKIGPSTISRRSPAVPFSDGFVARVNAAGTALDYCGFVGGNLGGPCRGVAADAAGHAYIAVETLSDETSLPVRVGPGFTHKGSTDIYVAKLSTTGKDFVYAGFIGGSSFDAINDIAVDGGGALYVTGYTGSSEQTFPVKVGPDLTLAVSVHGQTDAFVAKVAPSGKELVYCGYIGGSYKEEALAIAVDRSGNAYVGGWTESSEQTFPVTVGPFLSFKGTPPFPMSDAFVAKVALTLLEGSGTARPGGKVQFAITATNSLALVYQLASAFSAGPIPIDTRQIELGHDGLLWISLSGLLPATFVDYSGTIASDGTAAASLALPAIAQTVGLKIHTAFVTLDPAAPSSVRAISNAWIFTIVP